MDCVPLPAPMLSQLRLYQNRLDKLGPEDSETLLYILQKVLIVLNSYEDLSPSHMAGSAEL